MTPFIAQITMFAGDFAPRGWAFCSGQLLPISQNTALFSLIGTTYGGDGRTTFGLPDLRGRAPIHAGSGPGLSTRKTGQKFGQETVTVNTLNMPVHNHVALTTTNNLTMHTSSSPGEDDDASGNLLGASEIYAPSIANTNVALAAGAITGDVEVTIGNAGGNQAMTNMPPVSCVNFIIALVGVFPSRS